MQPRARSPWPRSNLALIGFMGAGKTAVGRLVGARLGKPYVDVDVAITMDHLILAARSLDLGTCWVADFHPAAAREILGLPDGIEPIAFTPLGYPADQPRPKRRKSASELVRYERW